MSPNQTPALKLASYSPALQEAIVSFVETLRSAPNEFTAAPYWMILDPESNEELNPRKLAFQFTGPFFSRSDAERYLEYFSDDFTDKATVYCKSGSSSLKYTSLYNQIKEDSSNQSNPSDIPSVSKVQL